MPPRPPIQHLHRAAAFLRSGISAAQNAHWESPVADLYYACFHLALALLSTEGLSPSTHRGVVELFSLQFVTNGPLDRQLGWALNRLMGDRETAIYSVAQIIDNDAVHESAVRALAFLEATLPLLAQRSPETAASLPELGPLRAVVASYTAST